MLNPWTSNIIQFIFDGWVSLWVEICELITDLLWWVDYFPMENYSCIWSPLFLYLVWANPTNIPISGNTVPGTFIIMLWLEDQIHTKEAFNKKKNGLLWLNSEEK